MRRVRTTNTSTPAFDAASAKAGVPHETYAEKCLTFEVPDLLVDYARLRDLTIVPVPEAYDQWYAESVIFGSGRPTLILPETPRSRPFELGTIAVAWDFSRAAAPNASTACQCLNICLPRPASTTRDLGAVQPDCAERR